MINTIESYLFSSKKQNIKTIIKLDAVTSLLGKRKHK